VAKDKDKMQFLVNTDTNMRFL